VLTCTRRQAKALLKVPDRKEREEVDALKAELASVRKELQVRDARWKMTTDRIKKTLGMLQPLNPYSHSPTPYTHLQQIVPPPGREATPWAHLEPILARLHCCVTVASTIILVRSGI
jgi:hypothetical protein